MRRVCDAGRTTRPVNGLSRPMTHEDAMASTTGTIKRLTDRGFGFIAAPDGTEYFFLHQSVRARARRSIRSGRATASRSRSVRARRAPAPRTSPPRKSGRRSVTRAGGRSGGLARVGSGVRSDIVHLTPPPPPPRRGLLVIVQDCRGHLDRARPPSVDLHRQARILSVGLVRACDDSCNNTLCASGGQGCRRGGTVEHWRLLRPSR